MLHDTGVRAYSDLCKPEQINIRSSQQQYNVVARGAVAMTIAAKAGVSRCGK